MFFYKNTALPTSFKNLFTKNNQIHTYNTRSAQNLHTPLCRMNTRKSSVSFQGAKLFNFLNDDIINSASFNLFNPRSFEEKTVTRTLEGVNRTPPPPAPTPSTVDTIHPIDKKFGTCKKLHLYFQLSESTWRLIGFYDNDSQINNVTSGRHLGF